MFWPDVISKDADTRVTRVHSEPVNKINNISSNNPTAITTKLGFINFRSELSWRQIRIHHPHAWQKALDALNTCIKFTKYLFYKENLKGLQQPI